MLCEGTACIEATHTDARCFEHDRGPSDWHRMALKRCFSVAEGVLPCFLAFQDNGRSSSLRKQNNSGVEK
jgi:hypothetical protein